MTGTVFYWSDLHLGHNKVAELRGFSTTEDHDAAIIDAWATTVTPRDTVWILGDLTAGNTRDRMLNVGVDHWPTPARQDAVLDWLDNIA